MADPEPKQETQPCQDSIDAMNSPDTFLIIQKTKNRNCVLYQMNRKEDGKPNLEDPVKIFWLKIEPSYIDARRAKGIENDRQDLLLIDKIPYNASGTLDEGTEANPTFTVSLNAFGDGKWTLVEENGQWCLKPLFESDIFPDTKTHRVVILKAIETYNMIGWPSVTEMLVTIEHIESKQQSQLTYKVSDKQNSHGKDKAENNGWFGGLFGS